MAASGSIYKDISARTGGDIYLGVVGPVRSGKSTFIKNFLDSIVVPNIEGEYERERAIDEMPQSSGGRTIMTTEPKFIPEEAVEITLDDGAFFRVRLVDCVGFVVPSAIGYIEDENPRMVHTPWYDHEIPFNMAAELGTKKVISEHSTIGIVITTDGSISDIPRDEYEEAEERVIDELKSINKPFVVLLNCLEPESSSAQELADELTVKYAVPVIAVNCIELDEAKIKSILSQVLFEFPVNEIEVKFPNWLLSLPKEHWLKKDVFESVNAAIADTRHIRDMENFCALLKKSENIIGSRITSMNLSVGSASIDVVMKDGLFYQILKENTGIEIANEQDLMNVMIELSTVKMKYKKIEAALNDVNEYGYGIVMPEQDELSLEEPELMKQGGRYGVRLRASAPSIHMLKADIKTEVAPIVGSESQSEDLVLYLMKQFEENPKEIWNSDIFGKSIYSIVNEGLNNKLYRMPMDARGKLRETVERVINEGCNGLICIIL